MPESQASRPKLICIPFAGAGSNAYQDMHPFLAPHFDLLTLEAPGRGGRQGEPFAKSLEVITLDFFESVQAVTKGLPFVIFGHSMGALLAFLLARTLQAAKASPPSLLIVSGFYPPGRGSFPKFSHLPRDEFIQSLAALADNPEEPLLIPELQVILEPILRSDFRLAEAYRHNAVEKLSVPITLFLGKDDFVDFEEGKAWADETTGPFEIKLFPGKHFFVVKHAEAVAQTILQTCKMIVA